MNRLIATILILLPCFSYAEECELILHKLVEKLDQQGKLASGENIYLKKFSAKEFSSSCKVSYKSKDYVLYLHPDEVSIVVSFAEEDTGYKKFKGPFFSAYKK